MANESPSAAQADPQPAKRQHRPKYDWDKAQFLFAQGYSHREISQMLSIPIGTIAWRSSKAQWRQIKRETALAATQETAQQWVARTSNWRERMATIAERNLDCLDKTATPTSVKGLSEWFDALDKLDKIGRRQFGLDTQASSPQVQVITSGNVLLKRDDREREGEGDGLGAQGEGTVDV